MSDLKRHLSDVKGTETVNILLIQRVNLIGFVVNEECHMSDRNVDCVVIRVIRYMLSIYKGTCDLYIKVHVIYICILNDIERSISGYKGVIM